MPRFFFSVQDDADPEGTVLHDAAEARAAGIVAAGEMIREGLHGETWTMAIRDEAGGIVCKLRFSAENGPSV